jgi:hypothetical protein
MPLHPESEDPPVSLIANKDLEKMFTRFYSLELIGIAEQANDEQRVEEVEAETLLKEKAYFKDGAWVMPLLFKPEARLLCNNVQCPWLRNASFAWRENWPWSLIFTLIILLKLKLFLMLVMLDPYKEEEKNEEFAFYLPHCRSSSRRKRQ